MVEYILKLLKNKKNKVVDNRGYYIQVGNRRSGYKKFPRVHWDIILAERAERKKKYIEAEAKSAAALAELISESPEKYVARPPWDSPPEESEPQVVK